MVYPRMWEGASAGEIFLMELRRMMVSSPLHKIS